MITGLLIQFAAWFFGELVSIIPLPGAPDWLTATSAIGQVFQGAAHLGAWFPVTLVMTVIFFVAAMNVTGFVIKLARICLSLFTGGGGSTG